MALPLSLLLETLARCSRNQVSNSMTSGRLRSARTAAIDFALDPNRTDRASTQSLTHAVGKGRLPLITSIASAIIAGLSLSW
jgi:hypothetical protein